MPEHKWKHITEPDLIDIGICSCGWRSKPYYDGVEYAYADWKKHVLEAVTQEEKQHEGRGG